MDSGEQHEREGPQEITANKLVWMGVATLLTISGWLVVDRLSRFDGDVAALRLEAARVSLIAARMDERVTTLGQELSLLRQSFDEFRKPGDRFTADDGKHLQRRIERLEHKLRPD